MRIYLDLDDTLVDFKQGCLNAGVPDYERGFYHKPRETWSQHILDNVAEQQMTLMRQREFWQSLPLMPRAHELMSACSQRGDTYLLTATPHGFTDDEAELVRRAKVQYAWQVLHVPPERIIVCVREQKTRYAYDTFNNSQNLLIDDAERNCREWIDANGIAHHFHSEDGYEMENAIAFIKCL